MNTNFSPQRTQGPQRIIYLNTDFADYIDLFRLSLKRKRDRILVRRSLGEGGLANIEEAAGTFYNRRKAVCVWRFIQYAGPPEAGKRRIKLYNHFWP